MKRKRYNSNKYNTYNLASNQRARKRRLSALGDGIWGRFYKHTVIYDDNRYKTK